MNVDRGGSKCMADAVNANIQMLCHNDSHSDSSNARSDGNVIVIDWKSLNYICTKQNQFIHLL